MIFHALISRPSVSSTPSRASSPRSQSWESVWLPPPSPGTPPVVLPRPHPRSATFSQATRQPQRWTGHHRAHDPDRLAAESPRLRRRALLAHYCGYQHQLITVRPPHLGTRPDARQLPGLPGPVYNERLWLSHHHAYQHNLAADHHAATRTSTGHLRRIPAPAGWAPPPRLWPRPIAGHHRATRTDAGTPAWTWTGPHANATRYHDNQT